MSLYRSILAHSPNFFQQTDIAKKSSKTSPSSCSNDFSDLDTDNFCFDCISRSEPGKVHEPIQEQDVLRWGQ